MITERTTINSSAMVFFITEIFEPTTLVIGIYHFPVVSLRETRHSTRYPSISLDALVLMFGLTEDRAGLSSDSIGQNSTVANHYFS